MELELEVALVKDLEIINFNAMTKSITLYVNKPVNLNDFGVSDSNFTDKGARTIRGSFYRLPNFLLHKNDVVTVFLSIQGENTRYNKIVTLFLGFNDILKNGELEHIRLMRIVDEASSSR